MHINWDIPIGTIALFAAQFVFGTVALMRALSAIEKSIDGRFNKMELVMSSLKDGDIRSLQERINRLEAGADEWTKTLRERTHDHNEKINVLTLEVDRLKRPERYPRAEPA
jgi:hypothetical protein